MTLYGPTLVIVLAVVEVMVLGVLVGRGRVKYGVDAPATTGHQNSIEQLVLFVPLFFAYCFNTGLQTGVLLGAVYLIARILYAAGYVRDPSRRRLGAFLTFGVLTWLAVGAVIGLVVKIART
ncbi:MAG TPA: MAPEG family protein [Candidatus Binatia bacterium]|nr:MAPEG family protein [Candidatus Binatia bacterium]